MIPKTIEVTVELGGRSVCGMEDKPDSCLDCSELPNCVLDNFYATIAPIKEKHQRNHKHQKKDDPMICRHCGKKMVKHIIKEGARYHVTSWYRGENGAMSHCSEKDCENNHGVGHCVPGKRDSHEPVTVEWT
jgi:hypothetical protein